MICCIAQLHAQNAEDIFSSQLKDSLTSYYKKYPAEKVFVHTNQEFYCSGETIWYKAYNMAYGKPSALSSIIYVQLTDTAGNVAMQNKLSLVNGGAHGNLDLNRQLKTGWYKLSAFTAWMLNFDRAGYYQQRIFIRNLADQNTPLNTIASAKKAYHVNFYPEGGDLIEGNISKIAFRALSDDGTPAKIAGVVKDNTNTIVANLVTTHDGMGWFNLEAFAGATYTASVQFPDGSRQEVKLPKVQQSGIYLQAVQNLSAIQVKLAYTGPAAKYENCTLAALQNNGQVSTYPLKLGKGVNQFNIQKADFSTGILRLTIFDSDKFPCAERILFINKHDIQPISLKADSLSFTSGGHNSFSAILKDKDGQPVSGNFSVSVTDAEAFSAGGNQNIFSALLLSPELKGEVNAPAYYFKNNSDSLARQLDLVMLTNGWRHFVWQKILNGNDQALTYPVEKSQDLSGKINGYQPGAAEKDLQFKILVMNQDSTKFVGYIKPDNTGSFIIRDFNHSGMSYIYLETAGKKITGQKYKSMLFPTLGDSLRRSASQGFTGGLYPMLNSYYLSVAKAGENARFISEGIMLNTINVRSTKTTPVEKLIKEHVSPIYQSNREFTLDLANNPTLNIGLLNYIRGKFPGLQIFGDNATDASFIYRGGNSLGTIPGMPGANANKGEVPYCYLNEARVDFGSVADIELFEVAMIRFMPPPVSFAPFNGGNVGALMIYTKKPADDAMKMERMAGFDHFIFNGYSVTREFNSLDYNKAGLDKSADNRTTLFWGHDINTDSKGALKFHFNNSSRTQKFRVIAQGMDAQGRLAYFEQEF